MPQSKRPRKKGRARSPEEWAATAQAHDAQTRFDQFMASDEPLKLNPNPPRREPVHTPPPAPAQPHRTHSAPAPRAARGMRRYGVPVAVGAAGVGAGAYLLHRRRRSNVGKGLVDPLTGDTVVFEKRYIGDEYDVAPRRGVLVSKARGGVFIPGGVLTDLSFSTGRTREDRAVSHANKLSHTRHNASPRDGRLHRIKHGGRSHSGTSIGKMFTETGHGVGRRMIGV